MVYEFYVNAPPSTTVTMPSNTFADTTSTYPYTYTWTTHIYLYQIRCPKRSCKSLNWLEINKITPCTGCGATLKAVSEQAEFEIAVEK